MILSDIVPAPPDAILGLTDAYRNDPRSNKVNLGVGVYQDDTGITPIMKSVKAAEQKMWSTEKTKSYLSIGGAPEYKAHVQNLILGADNPVVKTGRARTAHTPGGTGGLRVGAEFLKQVLPDATVWVSTPTWANHPGIFTAAGFKTVSYSYYTPKTMGLDFDAMRDALKKVPRGDIVLLHVCCHNPTGVDLSDVQWLEIGSIAASNGWVPFLDFAYQGLGDDLVKDRTGLTTMASAVPELFVASSFSKNFGLYKERTGALTVIAENDKAAAAAFSHVEKTIRVIYSNPPAHGGSIVSTILDDAALRAQWEGEVAEIRDRIKTIRTQFVQELNARGVDRDFSFIESQKGMFSFSGLSDEQVAYLKDEKAIYIVKGGRVNVAGITSENIGYLCDSIAEALKK